MYVLCNYVNFVIIHQIEEKLYQTVFVIKFLKIKLAITKYIRYLTIVPPCGKISLYNPEDEFNDAPHKT